MVYTERYNTFEAGFLKEAADQGMDVAYLEGMIAQATEIQEKWAAAFDELEEITGDNTVKIKIGNDIAQWTLMKHAEGESWYDPANPQMQKLLSHFGGGSQGQQGAIGGGVGGGLLGLILGLMTKNPMLGLMLGGLGGAGFGGLLGSGKFKEWFGNKGATPEAVSQVGLEGNNLNAEQEANGGPASDPAQAPRTTGDTELAAQLQGAHDGAANTFNQSQSPMDHADPELIAQMQGEQDGRVDNLNQSQSPMEHADPELAAQMQDQPQPSHMTGGLPTPPAQNPPQPSLQPPNQTKMFPSAGAAPFRSIPNNNPVKFQNQATPQVKAPNVGTPNVPAPNVPAPNVPSSGMPKMGSNTLELGTIVKKAHFKLALSGMMSGPSYSGGGSIGNQMQSSVLNMGQPTTSQQAPFLPKGAPIVYPNSSQPRQVNANYAVAPKV